MNEKLNMLNYALDNYDDFVLTFYQGSVVIFEKKISKTRVIFTLPAVPRSKKLSKIIKENFNNFFRLYYVPNDVAFSIEKKGKKVFLIFSYFSEDFFVFLTSGAKYSINGEKVTPVVFRERIKEINIIPRLAHDVLSLYSRHKKSHIAKALKITRKTVNRLINKYGG